MRPPAAGGRRHGLPAYQPKPYVLLGKVLCPDVELVKEPLRPATRGASGRTGRAERHPIGSPDHLALPFSPTLGSASPSQPAKPRRQRAPMSTGGSRRTVDRLCLPSASRHKDPAERLQPSRRSPYSDSPQPPARELPRTQLQAPRRLGSRVNGPSPPASVSGTPGSSATATAARPGHGPKRLARRARPAVPAVQVADHPSRDGAER